MPPIYVPRISRSLTSWLDLYSACVDRSLELEIMSTFGIDEIEMEHRSQKWADNSLFTSIPECEHEVIPLLSRVIIFSTTVASEYVHPSVRGR